MSARESPTPERPAGLFDRIRRSIFRGPIVPRDDRERRWVVFHHLVLHWRPVRVRAATIRFTHTWGLGGMGLVLFGLLAASGALLIFVYEPVPGAAYESLLALEQEVLFGPLVRNVHHWSANLLLVVVVLHLLRVFFTGGFRNGREFNWVVGLVLLLGIVLSSFTGYLLPWDQLSYWAVTISLGMVGYVPTVGPWLQEVIRGGPEVGAATLVRFHSLHTTALPLFFLFFMALHFWRVRKAKGVVVPRAEGEDRAEPDPSDHVLMVPNLLLKEVVTALVLIAVVAWMAALFDAPLGDPANIGMSPNPVKAPWYFIGLQELLIHFHPLFAVVVLPAFGLLGLLYLPYARWGGDGEGVWFVSSKGRRMAAIAAALALLATPAWVLLDELWVDRQATFGSVASDVLPAVFLVVALAGFHLGVRRWHRASAAETAQATFTLLFVALTVLTVIGVWFRGPGMALVWPWAGGAG